MSGLGARISAIQDDLSHMNIATVAWSGAGAAALFYVLSKHTDVVVRLTGNGLTDAVVKNDPGMLTLLVALLAGGGAFVGRAGQILAGDLLGSK